MDPDPADPDPVETLTAAVDGLLMADLSRVDALGLVGLLRAVEVQVRRLAVVDHRLVAEIDARGVGHEVGACCTADLLRQVLRVSSREAAGRVRAAADLGPRRTLTGDPLPPLFPAVAAAQSAGTISPAHARVITSTIDALPAALDAVHGPAAETFLVEHAAHLDPAQLGHAATRLADTLNPDGTHTDDADHQRRRELTLHTNRDGTGHLSGTLTPEATAVWQTVLDALSAPTPATDGRRDPRTGSQRRHDALLDAGQRLLRTGDLPDNGGTPVTIAVTITLDQLRTTTGHAGTSRGTQLSIPNLLRLAAEADIIPAVLNDAGGILAYGRTRRLATRAQRLALPARDRGCSFPGCDRPPTWCQAHHITPWQHGGHTDVDCLTLLCGHHHREFDKQGWTCLMLDGIPHWKPPTWLDPTQTPRRNTTHHVEITFGPHEPTPATTDQALIGAPP